MKSLNLIIEDGEKKFQKQRDEIEAKQSEVTQLESNVDKLRVELDLIDS